MDHDFVIGLGSNLGDRGGFLALAVERVAALAGSRFVALSPVYESEAVGPAQPDYLNAALRIRSPTEPETLLGELLAIERVLGRTRDVRWGPRVLDLDILWSERAIVSEHLTIPHAQLSERAFALAPLLDVAPELAPSYAAALQNLGGAPPPHGALIFDAARGTCAYAAARAV